MKFTVVGAKGFIGGAIVMKLRTMGFDVLAPSRDVSELPSALGHVIYAAGVTADFRQRPFDTLSANTTCAARILSHGDFDSFLYLSSARVYRHTGSSEESATLLVRPEDPEQLYDLTKLAGEAICHASGRSGVRIVRLANVLGDDFRSQNFVFDLIRSACSNGKIELRSSLDSAKDYIWLEDVVDLLPKIAQNGRHTCYNLASGRNISHRELVAPIVAASGATLIVREGSPRVISPRINIDRLKGEFAFQPKPLLPALTDLINEYRKRMTC